MIEFTGTLTVETKLSSLSDLDLIACTQKLVRHEREILTLVLNHLREVNRRRLYSYYGYKSLYDFAIKKLGYSADAAYRRISAMRLLSEIPEVEQKMTSGEVTLTHLNLAQNLFNQEKKTNVEFSKQEKIEVINQMAGKPVREAEKIIISLSSNPLALKADKIRSVSGNNIELKFTANESVQEKIEKLKGLLAHKNPNLSLGELFEKLCDIGLEQLDPSRLKNKVNRKVLKVKSRKENNANNIEIEKSIVRERFAILATADDKNKTAAPRKLSKANIRRAVFANAGNQCQNCGSGFALEVDHIQPKSLGGGNEAENLRLLCRACNQRAAIARLGLQKMESFLTN
jgi:5-methylcytosine-specific restriction endonuclease McrA